jgi:hypothetical protein
MLCSHPLLDGQTYAPVIKGRPLSDPPPFHVVWYQTVNGIDRFGIVSSICDHGVAMIQGICDSISLALSIKGCPEFVVLVTDSLSKEFMYLVYLVAPYRIKLFQSDIRETLESDAALRFSTDKRYKDFTTHAATDPQWEGLTFGKKGNATLDKYHLIFSNQPKFAI